MAESSSVDSTALEESEKEPDGLNLTSEILKEDEAYEKSNDSFLEDSIHKRAAKVLNLNSIKDLLPQQQRSDSKTNLRKSRAESLVNVIFTSMATDMRRAACSVSPSPNRLSRRTSCESSSSRVYSTSGSTSTAASRMNSTPKNDMRQPKYINRNGDHLSEEMQHICNLELLNDDSLLFEPELDLAFSQPHHSMDMLAAVGHLQERRGVHGGYGTPSSYASEQEMKLYFDSTPNPEQDSFSNDHVEINPTDTEESDWHAIALSETKMQNEIIAGLNRQGYNTVSKRDKKDKNGKCNALSSAVKLCDATVQKLEEYAMSDQRWSDDENLHKISNRKRKDKTKNADQSRTVERRKSDGNVGLRTLVKKRSRKPDARTRLSKMLKNASEFLIDNDLSDAIVINLTTPDLSQANLDKEKLAPFDSFQECLKQLKSFDSDSAASKSCDDYISEDYSPRSDSSSKDDFHHVEDLGQHLCDSQELVQSAIVGETFVNESIAQTYHSPLFKEFLSDHSTDSSSSSNDVEIDNTPLTHVGLGKIANRKESSDVDINNQELSLDLGGLSGSISSDDEILQENDILSFEITSSSPQSETPIYFERDSDGLQDVPTARNQQTVAANEFNPRIIDKAAQMEHSSSCIQTLKTEKDLEYYHTRGPNEISVEFTLENNNEEGIVLPELCSGLKQKDPEIAIVAQFASFVVDETVNESDQHAKTSFNSETVGNEKEIFNHFANTCAEEIIGQAQVRRKDLALGSCCDSGSESGYCTTNESKPRWNIQTEQLIAAHHVQPATSAPFLQKGPTVVSQETSKTKAGADKLEEVTSETLPLQHHQTVDPPNLAVISGASEGQAPIFSEISVFEAKASAFASCIQSFEDYEPQKFTSNPAHEPITKEKILDQKSLDEVAKDCVARIIKNCLTSLQNNAMTSSVVASSTSNIQPSSDIPRIKPLNESKHNSKNTSDQAKVEENVFKSGDTVRQADSCIEPSKSKKSTVPKILVTCPSIDVVDEYSNENREFVIAHNVQKSRAKTISECTVKTTFNEMHLTQTHDNVDGQVNKKQSFCVNDNTIAPTTTPASLEIFSPNNNRADVTKEKPVGESFSFAKNSNPENARNEACVQTNCAASVDESKIAEPSKNDRNNEETPKVTLDEQFALSLKCKYKDLDEQIDRILNPTPSPPPKRFDTDILQEFGDGALSPPTAAKRVRFEHANKTYSSRYHLNDNSVDAPQRNRSEYSSSSKHDFSRQTFPERFSSNFSKYGPVNQSSSSPFAGNCQHLAATKSADFRSISETLRFIKENLNRNDESVKRLEENIRASWVRMLALDEDDYAATLDDFEMSRTPGDGEGPSKIRALEEVVGLLKKHIHQRESEINGLGNQLRQSNEKIKMLEQKLKDKNQNEFFSYKASRDDRSDLTKELQSMQKERDGLQKQINERIIEKEDAQVATRKARRDLDMEKQKTLGKNTYNHTSSKPHRSKKEELRERVDELEYLNKSSHSDYERAELDLDSIKRENRSLRAQNDQSLVELKTDNLIMREKLDRMNEISAENLLLQSDAADFQAELADLRTEAKHLRSKCYELTEDNRQSKAEIRDLRRYIELLKSNKTGDSRQDLLNKIEYYQMEHDRLIDEIRRLKQRLGEVSPRSPRQRPASPRSHGNASYPGPSSRSSPPTVTFSKSLERGRSPVSDAIAASTASSLAAVRLVKERSLSPSAALNIRDLTMDRYNQHLDGRDSPCSVDSDSTELLLKPEASSQPGTSFVRKPTASYRLSDDDDDFNVKHKSGAKLSDSYGSNNGRLRSSSRGSMGCSPCKRSCSPTNPGGFRSISPKMTSTQNDIPDTARDRYPTKIKKSLPRRAFAPRSPADLKLGYSIKFTRPGGRLSRGTVKYIGHLPTRNEIFIGVELDGYDGKHSGTFQGTKYFTCPTNKGIFTPFSKVIMAWE